MTTERAQELQENITREAIAMLVVNGAETNIDSFKESVIIIGEAWNIPESETVGRLDLIMQEKAAIESADTAENINHVLPESELPINESGLKTLGNIWDLFEAAAWLDNTRKRLCLFNFAAELAEYQNLLDWIEKTDAEKEALELANAGPQAQEPHDDTTDG